MNDVTLICCFNDINQFNELKASIKEQNADIVLLGIDNRNSDYQSCSSAYNTCLKQVKTDIVIFIHQDVLFIENNTVSTIVDSIRHISGDDLVGVAGTKFNEKRNLTNIVHDTSLYPAGKKIPEGLTECDTLDECLFGGYTSFFIKNPFDEKLCNGWHLYCADRCLDTKSRGNHVYICGVKLIHKSKGFTDQKFNDTFYLLCKKYRSYYPKLRTTCGESYTDPVRLNMWYLYIEIKLVYRLARRKILGY